MKLVVSNIYKSNIYKQPVIYMGYQWNEECKERYHQFEYVLPEDMPPADKGGVIGYGQTERQMIDSKYEIHKTLTVLHGRPS